MLRLLLSITFLVALAAAAAFSVVVPPSACASDSPDGCTWERIYIDGQNKMCMICCTNGACRVTCSS